MAGPRLQSTRTLLPVSLAGASPRGRENSYQRDASSRCYWVGVTAALKTIGTRSTQTAIALLFWTA